jgi:transcriptional regulator with XRE-family HTH domain
MKSIKQLRKSLGITQRDLAGYLSISRSQLSMIETGRASISTPALLRLTVIQQVMMGNAPAGHIEPDTGRQLAKTNKMLRVHAQRHDWKPCAFNTASARPYYRSQPSCLTNRLPAGRQRKRGFAWKSCSAEHAKK